MKGSQECLAKIVESMLKSRAVIENDKECVEIALREDQFPVLTILFNHGTSPSHLTVYDGDTPIHAALFIGLEKDKGNFSIFEQFIKMFQNDEQKYCMLHPCLQDKYGDCLFHLVAKMKYNKIIQKAIELLCDLNISSNVRNLEGKLPIDYITNQEDKRVQYFQKASENRNIKVVSQNVIKPTHCYHADNLEHDISTASSSTTLVEVKESDVHKNEQSEYNIKQTVQKKIQKESVRKRIERLIAALDEKTYIEYTSKTEDQMEKEVTKLKTERQEPKNVAEEHLPPVDQGVEAVAAEEAEGEDEEKEGEQEEKEGKKDDEDIFLFDPHVFESLQWEVECTANVWKTLRDKHVPPKLKRKIVHEIQKLASGEWIKHRCKKLNQTYEDTLQIFEVKISKANRIIWELAIAFSPRLNETNMSPSQCKEKHTLNFSVRNGKVFSEIIRVWDIVFNHDRIHSSVQRICKSYSRGKTCIIQKKLKGLKYESVSDNTSNKIPRIFEEADVNESNLEEVHAFNPPASPNEKEYHILKFYSFSPNLVSHILQNLEVKVDFPFQVTDLEHDIINLKTNAPILLVGRSGTEKTTCTLYRLWSRFLCYWTNAESPLLPRSVIYKDQEDDKNCKKGQKDESEADQQHSSRNSCKEESENIRQSEDDGQIYDHLHQIFITKNIVLCNEVQKNFREMMNACDITKKHVEAVAQNISNRLQDINDYQFPVFVTSRQLLIMLDASLDPPYFFDRNDDGSLKVNIHGWDFVEGPLNILSLLQEDSDSEYEEGEMENNDNEFHQNNKRIDPRREMTYELFSESVWPKINKDFRQNYHPALVWMEIMSFIKGSCEALSNPNGFLDVDEYQTLGKKRAPNFSGEREHVYEIFERYELYRKRNFLFDETDLVRNIYQRLREKHDLKWVIHQIFVDEVQDFTQAELCLLLRLCQNPNDMFLTGDTAQGIMRGISFRFSDLQALFFYANKSLKAMGKASGISVPETIYQLTQNYRSHAGVLALASRIIDLLIEFFPESFDKLNRDQGLFEGPRPVLMESCSFSDLALLLRGNKRKTSHIEFGAHQAILVVNDAARENLPEELQYGLVLTIYEAKGLEFDDILLYNFFKDSQASKDWRVVTDFLETVHSKSVNTTTSLVPISSEFLQQKVRPRPLTFDPLQHKILNSELKHLYTAITRARVNVWIFDEDPEKRGPMFEYFKALNLVKTVSYDSVHALSDRGMFAEESTQEEWLKRAQEFMSRNLYEVAAKCYKFGGNLYMEKIAMANQTALQASRMKENASKMKDTFCLAAEQYLEVKEQPKYLTYAVKCLRNAKESKLLCQLYEKMGQLDKAADVYKKMRRPIELSACYEKLELFDKAIETLYEHELYEIGIETLERYRLLLKEFEDNNKPVPQKLREHGPPKKPTEEQMIIKASEVYHKCKKTEEMLNSLNRLSCIDDKVAFLQTHHNQHNDYIKHAAQLLIENGEVMKALPLYIDNGMMGEATLLARNTGQEAFVGYCLIVDARRALICYGKDVVQEKNEEKGSIIRNLEEAFRIFKGLQNHHCFIYGTPHNYVGEASLLLGQLTNELNWIHKSWGAFRLDENLIGQLECMQWMVYHSDLLDRQNLFHVVKGMKTLYDVLTIVCSPQSNALQLDKIYNSYGLKNKTKTTEWVFNSYLKPIILQVLKGQGIKINNEATNHTIDSNELRTIISRDLLTKGKQWFQKLQKDFGDQCKHLSQCPLHRIGVLMRDESECCDRKHKKMTHSEFQYLLELKLFRVLMDSFVETGARRIFNSLSQELCEIQNNFYNIDTRNYSSCRDLISSVTKYIIHATGTIDLNESAAFELKTKLRQDNYTLIEYPNNRFNLNLCRSQIERMLTSECNYVLEKKNKKREMHAAMFMRMKVVMQYFVINIPLDKYIQELESKLMQEYNEQLITQRKLITLGFTRVNKYVYCHVRRFLDSYRQLEFHDPEKAFTHFSKFIEFTPKTYFEHFQSEFDMLVMWIEFYSVIAICLDCKSPEKQDTFALLPSSFISTLNFVDSSFPINNCWSTFHAIEIYIQNLCTVQHLGGTRTKNLFGFIARSYGKMNFIRLAFKNLFETMNHFPWSGGVNSCPNEHVFEYTDEIIESIDLAEKVLIVGLVFVCNPDSVMLSWIEMHILREICAIKLPQNCPKRLVDTIQNVQRAKGTSDIVHCLKLLLKERGHSLIKCFWDSKQNTRNCLVIDRVFDISASQQIFYQQETPVDVANSPMAVAANKKNNDDICIDHDDEIGIDYDDVKGSGVTDDNDYDDIENNEEETVFSVEEKDKIVEEHKVFEEEQKRMKSANIIVTFFRHVKFLSRCRHLRSLCQREKILNKEKRIWDLFKDIALTESMCGICGIHFNREEEQMEFGYYQDGKDENQSKPLKHTDKPTSKQMYSQMYSKVFSSSVGMTEDRESSFQHLDGQQTSSFPSLAESTRDDLKGLRPFQKHDKSLSHIDKRFDFNTFCDRFHKDYEKSINETKTFIDNYELDTPQAKTLYSDITLDISYVIADHEKVIKEIRNIIERKNWKENNLEYCVKEMLKRRNEIRDDVKKKI